MDSDAQVGTLRMESMRSTSPDGRCRRYEIKDSKSEGHDERNGSSNESRLSAPFPIYPFQRYRHQSEEDEMRLSLLNRPVASRVPSGTSARRTFKSYTISEILKTNDKEREDVDHSSSLSLDRHCYAGSREPSAREHSTCWSYEDGTSSQQCLTCCQCYNPSLRYPYAMPYRSWQDRDAFLCGYPSTSEYTILSTLQVFFSLKYHAFLDC